MKQLNSVQATPDQPLREGRLVSEAAVKKRNVYAPDTILAQSEV